MAFPSYSLDLVAKHYQLIMCVQDTSNYLMEAATPLFLGIAGAYLKFQSLELYGGVQLRPLPGNNNKQKYVECCNIVVL